MKYISITGHISSMNHVVRRYLSRYDIQLERPVHPDMDPFSTLNPYAVTLQKAEHFLAILGAAPVLHMPMDSAEAVNRVEEAHRAYEERSSDLREKEKETAEIEAYLQTLEPFAALETDISELEQSEWLHYRAGRFALAHYKQYEAFLQADEKIVFVPAKRDAAYVWGLYLTPAKDAQAVDAVFASLHFEPLQLTAACLGTRRGGTPVALLRHWRGIQAKLAMDIRFLTQELLAGENESTYKLRIACEKVRALYDAFDVKKYARLSRGRRIFSFSGWMGAGEADALEAEISGDALIVFARHALDGEQAAPTRLRNPPVIRQFEFFTRLYGLPAYGEADPTPVLATTYTLLFGLMFGDVGHGLCLALLGAVLYWRYKKPLGGIIAVVGVSAAVFGFLYGSIFGVETVLPALWRRPAADIMGTLMFALGLGVALIVLSMALHMYNAIRQNRTGDFLFGPNGAAGLVFYGSVLFGSVRALGFGRPFPFWLVLIPLALLAFKHPLTAWLEGRRVFTGGAQFVFQTFMELFETLLTYMTNTVSFVRVGAFAVSHAGMMHVVLQLSQGASLSGKVAVLVLGNLLVMGIEGLLVGIQVLRLDFYELFSRFYKGGGKAFTSHRINKV